MSVSPKVIASAKKAISWEKGNPAPYFYLGEANRLTGNSLKQRIMRPPYFEAAVAAYRQELAIFPQDEKGWGHLGEALDGLKRFPEAETAYLTAINLDPNLGVLYGYYAAHLQVRGRSAAAQQVRRAGEELSRKNLAPILDNALDAPNPAPVQ